MIENLLSKSAYQLMSTGGDHRITIDENIGFNIYGCKPYPTYSVAYSSCTGSNISLPAYSYVMAYWNRLQTEISRDLSQCNNILKREFKKISDNLRNFYQLDSNTEYVFGPSGTDLEYIALFLTDKIAKKGVCNIILGLHEVGSGIDNAAKGRYFSNMTPSNVKVQHGELLNGFQSERISTVFVPIRNENGEVFTDNQLSEIIEKEIEAALEKDTRPLIHVIHSSKTGLVLPNWDTVLKIKNKYKENIDIIVDACQGRISIHSIKRYMSIEVMLLLTGSKFLSGPPFSGILVLPNSISKRVQNLTELPAGLSSIFGEAEFPPCWHSLSTPHFNLCNIGLLLRWEAARYEMNKFFRVPDSKIEYILDCFEKNVIEMVNSSDFLSLLNNNNKNKQNRQGVLERNSIFTILITPLNTVEEVKILHRALYSDISHILSLNSIDEIDKISIQLGQPVSISQTNPKMNTTLRIALSAQQISELAQLDESIVQTRFEMDMKFIKQKIQLILNNFDKIKFNLNL